MSDSSLSQGGEVFGAYPTQEYPTSGRHRFISYRHGRGAGFSFRGDDYSAASCVGIIAQCFSPSWDPRSCKIANQVVTSDLYVVYCCERFLVEAISKHRNGILPVFFLFCSFSYSSAMALLRPLDKLDLRLTSTVASSRALDRDDRSLGDTVATPAALLVETCVRAPAVGAGEHLGGVVAVAAARADVLGAALLEATEQARHTGHAGANDAHVELDQRPHCQLRVVHGRVRAERPADEGLEANHTADGDEETDQEGEDDADLLLP